MAPDRRTVVLDDGRRAVIVFTDVDHGDLRIDLPSDELGARRRAVTPAPWTWLRQVHGSAVVVVGAPGDGAGREADAAVTSCGDAPLAVHTADCAPVALVAPAGGVGAVHAGWRGLEAGVLAAAVAALRELVGDHRVHAVLGPCIHPECYEFGAVELERLTDRWGPMVEARTRVGRPALDLPAAVAVALGEVDVDLDRSAAACTACGAGWWSHRGRAERARQALVAWISDGDETP